jgi:peroxiredoxin
MAIDVGQEAPDFTLKNPDNEEVTLSASRPAQPS